MAVDRLGGGRRPPCGGVKGTLISVARRLQPGCTEAWSCSGISPALHGTFANGRLGPGAQTSEHRKVARVRSGDTEPARWGRLGCRVSLPASNALALPPL